MRPAVRRFLIAAAVAASGAAGAVTPPAPGAMPASPSPAIADSLATLRSVPRHALPEAALRSAMADAVAHARPERFAVGVPLDLTLAHGRWDAPAAQTARWRLRLQSPGAVSMSAHLAPVSLPAGAQLWVYAANGQRAFGPYTQANVSPKGFWSPVVPGDELVIEARAPAASAKDLALQVAEGYHGYRDLAKATGGPGTSGSCNVDATCEAATWGNEIRSSALITIANSYECSGQLLNNVRQDKAKLFITARHCGIEHGSGPADSVNFYFGYQAACGQPAPALPDPVTGGAAFLADDLASDFSLIRALGTLPAGVYFAGWNATGSAPGTTGAAIHYPSGDEKKISLYDSINSNSVNIGESCAIDAWEVHWGSGTTEPGSSGGGLWDGTSHALIGVLSGGNASCTDKDGLDYFGRLERAWTPSPDEAGQLKHWLDPDNTCIARVPGLDGSATGSPITSGPMRCEGPASSCAGRGDFSGGGSAGTLALGMLGGLLLRLRRRH